MKKITEVTLLIALSLSFLLVYVFLLLPRSIEILIDEYQECPQDTLVDDLKVVDDDSLTMENVQNFIHRCRFAHPEIVVAQVKLESGNLKSKVARENNNIVGMRLAKQRPTTAIGSKYGYAIYESWKDCLLDYLLWQCNYAKGMTQQSYLEKLQHDYASDENYVTKITKIANGAI